jgi:hypothetical protein
MHPQHYYERLIMSQINNTPRKYPRTLHEAFPHEADNAYTITRYKGAPNVDWVVAFVCIFALGFLVGALCAEKL